MSFQFSGSLSFIHVKHEKSPTGFIHLSKTNTCAVRTLYDSKEFVMLFIRSVSTLLCY